MIRKLNVALRSPLPTADVAPRSSARWNLLTISLAVFLSCTATLAEAQTFTTILTFDGSDGADPILGLVQGTDGSFYGTSAYGGQLNNGTIFKVSSTGTIATLHEFCVDAKCIDGQYPRSSLLLGNDGSLYGTTAQGGATDFGSVYRINSKGMVTLYSFCPQKGCSDGAFPSSPLVQGKDGQFYGTTYEGGSNNHGTLFRLSPSGELTQLYRFCSETGCADGNRPSGVGMVQGTDGNFYGVTGLGGSHGPHGTVFKLTPSGKFTSLYSFCSQANCPDGAQPSGLFQATDGDFYGSAAAGGSTCSYSAQGCGTIFKITTAGELTVLYTFCLQINCYDGAFPAGLVQATDGNIYGVTSQGGQFGAGSIFRITLTGELTTLYSFCSQPFCPDGGEPSSLVQGTGGSFWGVTQMNFGGNNGPLCGVYCGTVFKFSAGLGPFVQALPNARKVGGTVTILGNSLKGTTGVSFNGAVAPFTVISASEIMATVPVGATTGKIEVATSHGTLKSNQTFHVTP